MARHAREVWLTHLTKREGYAVDLHSATFVLMSHLPCELTVPIVHQSHPVRVFDKAADNPTHFSCSMTSVCKCKHLSLLLCTCFIIQHYNVSS